MKTQQPSTWTGSIPRLFLYFFIPLSIVLIVVILISQSFHHQAMEQLAGSRDLRAVLSTVKTMENNLYNLQEDLTRAIQAVNAGTVFEQVEPWINDFDKGFFRAACEDGSILQPQNDRIRPDPKTIKVLCQIINESGIGGTAYRLETGESAALWMAQSIDGSNVLVGGVDLAGLIERSLAASANPDQFSIQIYDSDHLLLFESGRSPVSDHDIYHQGVLDGLSGQSGVVYPGGSHGSHIIAYAPIEPVNWVLMMDEAWEDISTPSLQVSQSIPLILIPVLLLAVVGLFFTIRWVIQPLQDLSNQTTRLEANPEDAFTQPVGGIQEIQSLQTILRDMYTRLNEAKLNLEQYIGGLTHSQEAERKKLARDLHDDVIQDLIALKQQMQRGAQVESTTIPIQQVIDKLRQFIRGLRPPYLDDLGWVTAIRTLSQEFQNETGLPIKIEMEGQENRLEPEKELILYRVVQEALTNIRNHSKATSIHIFIHFLESGVRVQIEDNGTGFTVPAKVDQLAHEGHYGILGMKERVEMAGGRIEIISEVGDGTTIDLFL